LAFSKKNLIIYKALTTKIKTKTKTKLFRLKLSRLPGNQPPNSGGILFKELTTIFWKINQYFGKQTNRQ